MQFDLLIIFIYRTNLNLNVSELKWKNPGRRSPTPEAVESTEETDTSEQEVENKDFDFDAEDFGGGVVTPQRRNPNSELKGSARKLTTSFGNVLSNMKRHRQLEEMDMSDDTPTKPSSS